MPSRADRTGPPVKAVLGPTNTGKTHLAIERLCAHSSGAIGFPLRLLAREVYDRRTPFAAPKTMALKALGRIKPCAAEIAANPRARSAIMRVAERTAVAAP
jgi:hypothetical protein